MKELKLKYGCNPNQKSARIFMKDGKLPINILNGSPSYINLLDGLNGWQLVKELKETIGVSAAASFKHVSPAGAAISLPLTPVLKKVYGVEGETISDIATAYIRARGADRMSSYGDFVALSDECDETTAKILSKEVSDGIIAPSYSKEALEILKNKRKGNYLIIEIDKDYEPNEIEKREIFGITFEQEANRYKVTSNLLNNIVTENKLIPQYAKRDLIIALITLKYTQSNSVCYAKDGQVIGIGAGQQSRIHCTRLAGNKADLWYLRQHPKVLSLPFKENKKRIDKDNAIDVYLSDESSDILDDSVWGNFFTEKPDVLSKEEKKEWISSMNNVSLASDAFFPFGDNIERARKSGVKYIAQSGGSIRDDNVIDVCNKYGIVMVLTGVRFFYH